jgi:flavin reductase (DIM6/NTAB) family NADH-FMN oxidoreductase RutF
MMLKSLGAATILYPTPASVIGTYDKNEKPNMMTAAWVGICCSEPPCVSVSLRRNRYSYDNIMERRAFTVNTPPEKYVKETDYVGIVTGREVNKFAITQLTPVKSELVDAPYVKEFPLVLECKLRHTIDIGTHTEFIGEIIDVKAEETILENGVPIMEKLKPILYAPGLGKYYGVGSYLGKAHSLGKKM